MSGGSETVRMVRVFVSSPGDVAAERNVMKELVEGINRSDGQAGGFRLELFRWEDDVVPQLGPKPQQVVDSQTPVYDIYVGIMSSRFGTPSGRYGSGTEKEYKDALKNWKSAGAPWITFYFDDAPSLSSQPAEIEQYLKVCKFREQMQKRGLYATYKGVRGSENGFYEKVSEHLRKIVRHLLASQRDDASNRAKPAEKNQNKSTDSTPQLPPEYLQWLLARCGEVELMGLDLKHGSGVRLNHVYTPLATSARPEDAADKPRGKKIPLPDEERQAVQLLLDLLDKQSLYVSGAPGSWKSTFCSWVTLLACNGKIPEVDVPAPEEYRETFPETLQRRLPVLIRLRGFWQHLPPGGINSIGAGGIESALESWLADQKYPGLEWACLKAHLESGSALLMLDGVDEVPPTHKTDGVEWFPRQMLLTGLAEAVARWSHAGNRVLLTSRPYGLNSEQQRRLGLVHAPILDLDPPRQELLVHRWFVRLKVDRVLGLETAAAMVDHIHVERGLDELAANPLLLTAMCIIYDQGKRLPHDKYTLYDRIVDTVMHKRYAEKERIEPIRARLAAVAYGMHTGDGLGQQRESPEASATEGEMDLLLSAYHQLDGSTDKGLSDIIRVREDLLSNSGLLVSRADSGASFFHLSIQEFLAAERLFVLHRGQGDEAVVTLLLNRGQSPGWRNTLSLYFGCLVAAFKPHAGVEYLRGVVRGMALPPTDSAERARQDPAWNQAIVVADGLQILAGREAAVPDDLTSFFRQCVFQAINQEIAVKERQTLALVLGQLGDPRIEPDLRVPSGPDGHPGYVKIPAGNYVVGDEKQAISINEPFWLSKYPVTNSQYARFMEAGGYTRREFWSDEGWKWRDAEGITSPEEWRTAAFNAPNQPVVGVSWWEADAFCRWAGGFLPTEKQWESAARGPEGFEYPWGDTWEDGICNSEESGLGSTSAVGIFPRDKSPFGLQDMAGSLEWCADWWEGQATFRGIRGGSRIFDAGYHRSANRLGHVPRHRNVDLGFRVAAVPPGKSSQEPAAERRASRNSASQAP